MYPCSPHLTHLSHDMARSLLRFAHGKPLGPDGINWLKLHVINLTGTKKREPVSARLVYAEEILPEILDSADNPLTVPISFLFSIIFFLCVYRLRCLHREESGGSSRTSRGRH